jgi:hypothetical protein
MLRRLSPLVFYGAAAAGAAGLALGFALHGPWQSFQGGVAPEILFSSAAAAELVKRPDAEAAAEAPIEASAPVQDEASTDPGVLYAGYGPANPRPLTRLAPDLYDETAEVMPASAGGPDGGSVQAEPPRQPVDRLDSAPPTPAPAVGPPAARPTDETVAEGSPAS